MSIFKHTQVQLPESAIFKISPSQISKFFDYPVLWYKSEVLGEKDFNGNTATTIGTAMHYIAEQYALSQLNDTPLDSAALKETIEADLSVLNNPDVDKTKVRNIYKDMGTALINEYLRYNLPTEIESELVTEIRDGIFVGGSCDNLTNSIVVDYKSASKKPNTDKIPWNYYIQLMAYAYMYRAQGKHVDRIRLVYTVQPTATLPIRVFTVTQQITVADWKAIEDVLTLITDTVLLSIKQPELKYLLFKSMQLKES
jgi:hypothetical protein